MIDQAVVDVRLDDPRWADLDVQAREASIGEVMDVDTTRRLKGLPVDESLKRIDEAFLVFGTALISWNLEREVIADDGSKTSEPIPATVGGLRQIPKTLALQLMHEWAATNARVPPPLPQPSGDGPPSPGEAPAEPSIPMELPSLPQAS